MVSVAAARAAMLNAGSLLGNLALPISKPQLYQRHAVHALRSCFYRRRKTILVHIIAGKDICKEDAMKLRCLELLCEGDPVFEVFVPPSLILWIIEQPWVQMGGCLMHEGVQNKLPSTGRWPSRHCISDKLRYSALFTATGRQDFFLFVAALHKAVADRSYRYFRRRWCNVRWLLCRSHHNSY